MINRQKILIVDDDNNIAELISLYLAKECFEMDDFENVEIDMSIENFWDSYLIPTLEQLRQLHNKNMELSKTPNITDQERKRLIVIAKK